MARSAMASFALLIAAGFAGCAATAHSQEPAAAQDAAQLGAMSYSDATPAYRFFPGDEVEITNYSAPALSRTVTIGPDGRIALPMIAPVRAADLTKDQLEAALVAAYASQLRTPEIDVTPKTFGSRQVFVGGEVARPGIYAMPANMDALQAVAMAGGFLPSARRNEVLVMSRAEGEATTREVNLSNNAIRNGLPGAQALQRYDIVYVPRSRISQVNLFMQQYVRDTLPIQFSAYYDLAGNSNR